jgi:preprotein translocase subunit YajC
MDISLLFPILILLLFIPIFLSSRKQKRAQAEMQSLQSSLEPGDIVSTTSGLRGTVVDASYEDTIDLEIADGVVTTWVRAAIREKIATDDSAHEHVADAAPVAPVAPEAPPAVVEEPAARPSLEKAEQPSLEKDDSKNGSPRS